MNKWWGYVHIEDGKFKLKRYFDERDIQDARESTFVKKIYGPVEADSAKEAIFEMFKNEEDIDLVKLIKETFGE